MSESEKMTYTAAWVGSEEGNTHAHTSKGNQRRNTWTPTMKLTLSQPFVLQVFFNLLRLIQMKDGEAYNIFSPYCDGKDKRSKRQTTIGQNKNLLNCGRSSEGFSRFCWGVRLDGRGLQGVHMDLWCITFE